MRSIQSVFSDEVYSDIEEAFVLFLGLAGAQHMRSMTAA